MAAVPEQELLSALLFAAIARRTGKVTPEALSAATLSWARDTSRTVGSILLDQGDIEPSDLIDIQSEISRELGFHGNDLRATLDSLGRDFRHTLESLDANAQLTLAALVRGEDPPELGAAESKSPPTSDCIDNLTSMVTLSPTDDGSCDGDGSGPPSSGEGGGPSGPGRQGRDSIEGLEEPELSGKEEADPIEVAIDFSHGTYDICAERTDKGFKEVPCDADDSGPIEVSISNISLGKDSKPAAGTVDAFAERKPPPAKGTMAAESEARPSPAAKGTVDAESETAGTAKGTMAAESDESAKGTVAVSAKGTLAAPPKGTMAAPAKGTMAGPAEPAAGGGDEDDVLWSDDDDDLDLENFAQDGNDGMIAADSMGYAEGLTEAHLGRYEIRQELGRGGIGRVMIALDKHVGREVALKELLVSKKLPRVPGRGPTFIDEKTARFLEEARITGQLEHPGIIPVYEIAQRDTGEIYYTMKVVRGETLDDKIQGCRTIRERFEVLSHFIELCQAIAYAHSRGVIHRDIKPANVMVGEFGETIVLDWGLAKIKGRPDSSGEKIEQDFKLIKSMKSNQTVSGRPIGTPSYMPPEQAKGNRDDIDERSDVWSLGAVLYELLTGFPPYVGENALEVVEKVISDPVKPVKELAPQAPPELVAICDKCLQKDKELRYHNAGEIATDIKSYQAGGLVSAYNYSVASLDLSVIMRWIKNRWPVFLTAGIAVLILFGVGAFSIYQINERRKEAELAKEDAKRQEDIAKEHLARAEETLIQAYESKRDLLVLDRAWGGAEIVTAKILDLEKTEEQRVKDRYALNYYMSVRPLSVLHSLWGHDGQVSEAVFSPDGKTLASRGYDGSVCLWNYMEGKLIHNFAIYHEEGPPTNAHMAAVSAFAFSPDGSFLATGGRDNRIVVWDTFSGRARAVIDGQHTGWVNDLAYSPDGKYVASGSRDWTVKVFNPETGELIPSIKSLWLHQGDVTSVAFRPDSKYLASAGLDRNVKLWDPETGEEFKTLHGHFEPVWEVAWSGGGSFLASGGNDGQIILWDGGGNFLHSFMGHNKRISYLAFSPDEKLLASAGYDNEVMLWDTASGTRVKLLEGHEDKVLYLAFSPDGKTLASCAQDNTVRLWDTETGKLAYTLIGHMDMVRSVNFGPDGGLLATASHDKSVRVWKMMETKNVFRGHEGRIDQLRYRNDGRLFVTAGQDLIIRVWDPGKGLLHSLEGHEAIINKVVFSPDGKTLASAGDDATTRLWDVGEGELFKRLEGHGGPVTSIVFSHDGRMLISAGKDQTMRIWNVTTGREIISFQAFERREMNPEVTLEGLVPTYVSSLAIDDEGTIVTGSNEGHVSFWDLAECLNMSDRSEPSDKEIREKTLIRETLAHDKPVTFLLYIRENGMVVSAGDGGHVKIWDQAGGNVTHDIAAHGGAITGLALSPDQKRLASASSENGTVRVWDTQTGKLATELAGENGHTGPVYAVDFDPTGKLVATGGFDNTVKLWEAETGSFITSIEDHSAVVIGVAFSPSGENMVSASYDSTIRVWPFKRDAIEGAPKGLLLNAQHNNGLLLKGMNFLLWDPATKKIVGPKGVVDNGLTSPAEKAEDSAPGMAPSP